MPQTLKHQRWVVSLAVVVLGLGIAGCGDSTDLKPSSPQSIGGELGAGSSPGSGAVSASADPSASEDWWPEEPETMATGQKIPEDYQPATLEHPARNVPKPVMPKEATQETEAGAQAFLDYYADASWYALQTGDTSLVREITSRHCSRCTEEFERTDRIYESGAWIAGGFEKSKILPGSFTKDAAGAYSLPVSLDSSGVKVIENGRVTIQQEPFETQDGFNGNLDYKEAAWVYITASTRNL